MVWADDIGLIAARLFFITNSVKYTGAEQDAVRPYFLQLKGIFKPLFATEQDQEDGVEGKEEQESAQEKPTAPDAPQQE